jgi:ABC-type amino acid transport system permease subunit
LSFIYPIYGGILVLFIHITRLSSNEIFSPLNKIHREAGRAKDLSAPLYILLIITTAGILILFIYITRLASNEIFSPLNKIHREIVWAKDLSAPL